MRTFFTILACSIIFLASFCNKKSEQDAATANTYKKIPFTPPSDQSISVSQMERWLSCNPRLDSLSYLYIDSFKTDDASGHLRYQQHFSALQDSICVQQGLTGGYEEYVWVLKNSGNEKNRAVLEALKLKSY